MTTSLRQAAPADAPAIARLIRGAKSDAMPWLAVLHSEAEDLEWVRGVLLPNHDVHVAVTLSEPDVLYRWQLDSADG